MGLLDLGGVVGEKRAARVFSPIIEACVAAPSTLTSPVDIRTGIATVVSSVNTLVQVSSDYGLIPDQHMVNVQPLEDMYQLCKGRPVFGHKVLLEVIDHICPAPVIVIAPEVAAIAFFMVRKDSLSYHNR